MSVQIRPLSHALGAEIIGVDIRKPLDDKTFGEIHDAYLKYTLLVLRGTPFSREDHIAFSKRFGDLDKNDHSAEQDKTQGFPEIQLKTKGGQTKTREKDWHSDRGYWTSPVSATILHGVELPELGGDTMFANMYLAYETLSDGMKKLIEGLFVVHPGSNRNIDTSSPERMKESRKRAPHIAQPIVRVHPDTGRKALFVSDKTKKIVGMTLEESLPVTRFLVDHAGRPQFGYTHQWRKDDLLMWDNRCLIHKVVGNYDKSQLRQVDKICVMGTPSGGYVYEGEAA